MVKKRSAKKTVKEECCNMNENSHCSCRVFLIKIASMAFLLFLMTIWTGLGRTLLSVHWGIYLGITLLLIIFYLSKGCYCCKKK